VKCKTSHGKSEEKGEFGSRRSESLCYKGDTLIMLGPMSIFRPNYLMAHGMLCPISNIQFLKSKVI
jgi:hypothetical protein